MYIYIYICIYLDMYVYGIKGKHKNFLVWVFFGYCLYQSIINDIDTEFTATFVDLEVTYIN